MKHTIAILATIALLVGMANADGLDGARSQLSSLIESSQNSFSGSSFDRTSSISNLGFISSSKPNLDTKITLTDLKARIRKDFSVVLADETPIGEFRSDSDNLNILISRPTSEIEYSGGRSSITSNMNILSRSGIPAMGSKYYHAELVNMLK